MKATVLPMEGESSSEPQGIEVGRPPLERHDLAVEDDGLGARG